MALKLQDDAKNEDGTQIVKPTAFSFIGRHKKLLLALGAVLTFGSIMATNGGCHHAKNGAFENGGLMDMARKPRCGKSESIAPSFNRSIDLILHDAEFKKKSIDKLSQAVQIPTEIQDVNPEPSEDLEYYKYFYEFHDYLEKTFPLIHEHLRLEKVNEIGLLFTWEGSEIDLKPLLFMAHQDVVPVNNKTWDSWEYPPFSGHYDEKNDFIWGRGSNDCKNLLIAELEAVEQLLKDDYKPKRTILLSFGFDEESSGPLGAKNLAAFIEDRYGKDSIFSIIDEGGGLVSIDENTYIAAPINAEKGYVDVVITVNGRGGHSSVPPDHTTIGVAADLITVLEDHPFDFDFETDNPLYAALTCIAEHSDKVPRSLKKAILGASRDAKDKAALTNFLSHDPRFRDLIRTTRAIDIVSGGIKANALPEVTSFLVNHRIDIHSSVNATVSRDLQYARKIAKKYGYGLMNQDEVLIPETDLGYIQVFVGKSLEPAPVSPTSGPVWDLIAGTIQDVFENGVFAEQPDVDIYVTTILMSGNTDTRYYWNLSKNIYRFAASIIDPSTMKTIHSVDEHVSVASHLSAIAFIYEYIVNVDEHA